jgi:hypothetical protein
MAPANEARMPLLDHLRELRKRVLRSAIAVLIAFGGGWYFYNPIITTLARPVCDLKAAQQAGSASCGALYISGVLGPLDLQIKVALLAGVIVSAPFWLYQLWAFIAPALHRKEKRTSVLFVIAATPSSAPAHNITSLHHNCAMLTCNHAVRPHRQHHAAVQGRHGGRGVQRAEALVAPQPQT